MVLSVVSHPAFVVTLRVKTASGAAASPQVFAAIMTKIKARLVAARVQAAIKASSGRRLQVATSHPLSPLEQELLTASGEVVFRIEPNGPTYHLSPDQPVIRTRLDRDQSGRPILLFFPTNSRSFQEFTAKYIGRQMALSLDHRTLMKGTIYGPISGQGVLIGNFSRQELRCYSAIINSKFPSNAKVTVVRPSVGGFPNDQSTKGLS